MIDEFLLREIEGVPDHDVFATVDEMDAELARIAAEHESVTLRDVGRSRLGHPLRSLVVGDGPRDAVVFGLPHPNEPIGGLTALHLARRLAEDAELRRRCGLRWHIIPCIDPDGARLNEGWFRGPFTREHYARHFYRPAGDEQVEWTFPFRYREASFDTPLPETRALIDLLHETRPALMCSLHNSELGGVYYYLSRPEPALYEPLQKVPEMLGLSLDAGEPEAPFIEQLADGVYRWPSIAATYDHAMSLGTDPADFAGGTSSSEYAEQFGTLTIVSELPYWDDPTAGDTAPSDTSMRDALRAQAHGVSELVDLLSSALSDLAGEPLRDSPHLRATRYFATALASVPTSITGRLDDPQTARAATVAELGSCTDLVHSFRLRYSGTLRRMLEDHVAAGDAGPAARRQLDRVSARYDAWLADAVAASRAVPIPIRNLVATQYAALVASARHVSAT
jgi:hypothetical protein